MAGIWGRDRGGRIEVLRDGQEIGSTSISAVSPPWEFKFYFKYIYCLDYILRSEKISYVLTMVGPLN